MSVSSLSGALVQASDEMGGQHLYGLAAARAYAGLRARIVSLDLLPDTVLSRAEIAKEYGVSQSPVREAIQKLEQEGLVVSYPKSKTLVTRIDVEQARVTQFLRLSVEVEIAKALVRRQDPDLLLPSSRILRMQKLAGEDHDIPEFTALDWLFHQSLFQAAGVVSLWHMISGRSGHIDRLRRLNLPDPGKMSAVLGSHERILAAIRKGSLEEAEAQTREHLSGTLASLPTIMAAHPDYFAGSKPA
jgi:GntR family transcriptional regulator, rspAB operon transcriptional repressor